MLNYIWTCCPTRKKKTDSCYLDNYIILYIRIISWRMPVEYEGTRLLSGHNVTRHLVHYTWKISKIYNHRRFLLYAIRELKTCSRTIEFSTNCSYSVPTYKTPTCHRYQRVFFSQILRHNIEYYVYASWNSWERDATRVVLQVSHLHGDVQSIRRRCFFSGWCIRQQQ